MTFSRLARRNGQHQTSDKQLRYSLRKVSTVGVASAVVGAVTFLAPVAQASEVSVDSELVTTTALEESATSEETVAEESVEEVVVAEETVSEEEVVNAEETVEEVATSSAEEVGAEATVENTVAETAGQESVAVSETEVTADSVSESSEESVEQSDEGLSVSLLSAAASSEEIVETPSYSTADEIEAIVLTQAQTEAAKQYGLAETAMKISVAAGLALPELTQRQIDALNRMNLRSDAETGLRMTYKDFEEIADLLVEQNPQYAIPYFRASEIKNLPAATHQSAQEGYVTDLDVWDSWPVQDAKTGEVLNWNGYQLVIAMMGVPGKNDHHIYLLYNKYGDNELANWKMAGSIFGYEETPLSQEWSGSATVNSDGTIQLYYTRVDTSDNNSNNQHLASATLILSYDEENVYLDAVENDKILSIGGGDGYYYQSYAQWRSTFTGADNIAMRDPNIIVDTDGTRYLVFEASTGLQNYQGEDQIYVWDNYGGDAAYNVKSLFRILENDDMYDRASWANAAIGILRLEGDEKTPEIAEYYTPILSSPMVSDEIERPSVMKIGDKYYMFAATRLNHGSNNDAWNLANDVVGDNVVMVGYVSDTITGGYQPLNGNGVVLTASVPADWRTATYSYFPVPVKGSDNLLLVTAYMTNRNEVAGKGNNATMAPSFLIEILPDGVTTRVLNMATNQGDWIWDEDSYNPNMTVGLEDAYLPGENDGIIEWNRIGGYGLVDHQAHTPEKVPGETPEETPDTPEKPEVTPEIGGGSEAGQETPTTPRRTNLSEKALPKTGESTSALAWLGLAVSALGLTGLKRKKA